MIFYSKQPIDLLQCNVIVIEDNESQVEGIENTQGYIVVSKNVYNTAVILSDRFGDAPSLIERKISLKRHQEFVDYFAENAPSPLHMLAPFLHLASPEVKMKRDIEMLCGYLHIMSMAIDFNTYLGVPEEVRKEVEFTRGQLITYKNSWEDLTLKLKFAEIDKNTIEIDFLKNLTTSICQTIIEQTLPILGQQTKSEGLQFNDSITDETLANKDIEKAVLEDPWAALGSLISEEIGAEPLPEESSIQEENKEESLENQIELSEEEKKAAKEREMMDSIIAMYGGV